MADSKIRIAAVGSKSEGINEINPRFQAEALRNIRGIDCGVLDNSFYSEDVDPYGVTKTANPDSFMFPIDISSYTVSIGRGMATAYGYDFQTEETIAITTLEDGTPLSQLSPGTATYYLFVYLEWNLAASPAEGSIKIHNNGTASIWRSLVTENSSNNLIRIPSGTYKLPIWRLTCTSTGLGNAVSWQDMNLCPTITRPQVAEVARFADDPTGVGDEIANTKYVDGKISDALASWQSTLDSLYNSFDSGTVYILHVPCTIQRENGLVMLTCPASSITTGGQPSSDISAWTKALYQMAVGDNVLTDIYGNETTLSEKYRPSREQGDVNIRINMYYYLTSSTGYNGTMGMYFTISTAGRITLASTPTELVGGSAILPTFAIGDDRFHIGWKCEPVDEPEMYRGYEVQTSLTGNILSSIPDKMEFEKTYTIRLRAKGYSEQMASVSIIYYYSEDVGMGSETFKSSVFSWNVDKDGDSEYFTFTTPATPSSGRTPLYFYLTASTRYYGDGTPDV